MDGQLFVVEIGAKTNDDALKYVDELLDRKGWRVYGYVIKHVEMLV